MIEAGDRRYRRMRAGCDDKPPGSNLDVSGMKRLRAREARRGADYLDPEPLEPLDRVVRRDRGDDARNASGGGREAYSRRRRHDAERGATPCKRCKAGSSEQRFRGHAAEIQAIAAHQPALDQHHLRPHLRPAGGDGKPSGTRPDDTQIGPERPVQSTFLWLHFRYPTGTSASSASPTIGRSTLGRSAMPRSGSSTTVPSPLPRLAKITVAGTMPRAVAST